MRELVVVGAKAKPKTGKTSYKITLSTADVENAGTKDNIKLTLIGESKNLDLLLRNNLGIKKADTREYGPFEFSNENIGVIKEVRIQLDNTRCSVHCKDVENPREVESYSDIWNNEDDCKKDPTRNC